MTSRLQGFQDGMHDKLVRRCPKLLGPLVLLFMLTSLIMNFLVTLSASITPAVYYFGLSESASKGNGVASASVSADVKVGLWGYCSDGATATAKVGPFSKSTTVAGGCSSPQMGWSFGSNIPIASSAAEIIKNYILFLVIVHLCHLVFFILICIFWCYTCKANPVSVYNLCVPFINLYKKMAFLGATNFDKERKSFEKSYVNFKELQDQHEKKYQMTMFRRAPRNVMGAFTIFTFIVLFLDIIFVVGARFAVDIVLGPAFYLQLTLTFLIYFAKGLLSTLLVKAQRDYDLQNAPVQPIPKDPRAPQQPVTYNSRAPLPSVQTHPANNAGQVVNNAGSPPHNVVPATYQSYPPQHGVANNGHHGMAMQPQVGQTQHSQEMPPDLEALWTAPPQRTNGGNPSTEIHGTQTGQPTLLQTQQGPQQLAHNGNSGLGTRTVQQQAQYQVQSNPHPAQVSGTMANMGMAPQPTQAQVQNGLPPTQVGAQQQLSQGSNLGTTLPHAPNNGNPMIPTQRQGTYPQNASQMAQTFPPAQQQLGHAGPASQSTQQGPRNAGLTTPQHNALGLSNMVPRTQQQQGGQQGSLQGGAAGVQQSPATHHGQQAQPSVQRQGISNSKGHFSSNLLQKAVHFINPQEASNPTASNSRAAAPIHPQQSSTTNLAPAGGAQFQHSQSAAVNQSMPPQPRVPQQAHISSGLPAGHAAPGMATGPQFTSNPNRSTTLDTASSSSSIAPHRVGTIPVAGPSNWQSQHEFLGGHAGYQHAG